jgi:hypothetical protein
MSSDKQLLLIIITTVIIFGYQWYKDNKRKNDYWKKYRRSQGWD